MENPRISKSELNRFNKIMAGFNQRKILVVGDIMADEYIWGKVERISPEAPVPVVWVQDESLRMGGAANVVHNLRALQGQVMLCGLMGQDRLGRYMLDQLQSIGVDTTGMIVRRRYRTIRKTRILAAGQQVVRVDREEPHTISGSALREMLAFVRQTIPKVDAVLLSDYGKGVLVEDLAREIISICIRNSIVCTVDPKISHFDFYKGVTVITPNHHEASNATGVNILGLEDMKRAARRLFEVVDPKYLLITYGDRGMVLFKNPDQYLHIPTVARDVYDVTGAGDSVISTLTLALATGASVEDAAYLSNFAAGVVVGKVGTVAVKQEEILQFLRRYMES